MTRHTDPTGRSMTERILDAHKENCKWPKKLIAEVLGTSEQYVNYVFQTYNIYVGKPQTSSNRERPTCGKMRGAVKFSPDTRRNEECRQMWLQDGKLHQCGLPTNGHTYCPDCAYERSVAPVGSRYASFSGPAFGFSRKSGAAA